MESEVEKSMEPSTWTNPKPLEWVERGKGFNLNSHSMLWVNTVTTHFVSRGENNGEKEQR
jgi:hypothetical protein